MDELDGDLDSDDYPWLLTLDEVLCLSIEHMEIARQSHTELMIGVHLKMASRAMRCALELYGDRLEKEKRT
jgi:hypothetical protein